MRCQVCGFEIKRPDVTMCPNCGWVLAHPGDQTGAASPTPEQSASPPPPPTSTVNQQGLAAAQPIAAPGPEPGAIAGTIPGATAGVVAGGVPFGAPFGAPAMPPYGWPAPPSMPYGAPGYVPPPGYGQPPPSGYLYAAPPTYPLPAGAPPSMPYGAPYPGYPAGAPYPGYPGGMPPAPPPAPPKRRVGLIVGIAVAVALIVIVGSCGALYALVPQVRTLVVASGAAATPMATAPVPAVPTATPSTQTGSVIFQDSLTDSTSGWSNVANECFYKSDGYHIVNGYICYAPAGVLTDFDVSVQVKQVAGPTDHAFGISFRATPRVSHYDFVITANSAWAFFKCVNATGTCSPLVDYTDNSAIRGGLNASNTLRVRAVGSHFTFYVNGTQVGQATDGSYPSGYLGLRVNQSMECVFANFVAARPS